MLQTLVNKLQNFRPQSASLRNVLKLAGGTAGSQLITIAASPIFTRLYGPASFGLLATFTSILALLSIVSSLSYQLAIAVPEDENEAIDLVWLCLALVAISTVLTALGAIFVGDNLAHWLNQTSLKPLLWLLPAGVCLNGLYQSLSYWAIRHRDFGLLAQTRFRQSVFGVMTTLAISPLGTIGLIMGQLVSQSSGFIYLLSKNAGSLLLRPITPYILVQTLLRYRHFGIFSSLASLVNSIGQQVPNLILATAFGTELLGELALSQRLLLVPASLIGSSVSQVFLSNAAVAYRVGVLPPLIRNATGKLIIVGLLASVLVCFGLTPMMPVIFGQNWVETQSIMPTLIPLFLGQLTISPISMAFIAAEANKKDLLGQLALSFMRIAPLLIGISVGLEFRSVLIVYSLASLAGYICYGFLLVKSI